MESENWQKENLEKSKEVLKDHFERRRQERMWKEMAIHSSLPIQIHVFSSFEIDNGEFEDWDKPMEKKPFFKKLKDNIVLAYYDFLLILWRIKRKITKK